MKRMLYAVTITVMLVSLGYTDEERTAQIMRQVRFETNSLAEVSDTFGMVRVGTPLSAVPPSLDHRLPSERARMSYSIPPLVVSNYITRIDYDKKVALHFFYDDSIVTNIVVTRIFFREHAVAAETGRSEMIHSDLPVTDHNWKYREPIGPLIILDGEGAEQVVQIIVADILVNKDSAFPVHDAHVHVL